MQHLFFDGRVVRAAMPTRCTGRRAVEPMDKEARFAFHRLEEIRKQLPALRLLVGTRGTGLVVRSGELRRIHRFKHPTGQSAIIYRPTSQDWASAST